jgi:hypothetical protein
MDLTVLAVFLKNSRIMFSLAQIVGVGLVLVELPNPAALPSRLAESLRRCGKIGICHGESL